MKIRTRPKTYEAIRYNLWNRDEIKEFVGTDGVVREEVDCLDNVSLKVTLRTGVWNRLIPGDVLVRIDEHIYRFVDAEDFEKQYEVID